MKNVIIFKFLLYGFILISLLNLSACVNIGGVLSLQPISKDDPCSKNLYELKSYNKLNMLNNTLVSWTKCMAGCGFNGIMTGTGGCRAECNKLVDTKKIVSCFISTSKEEQKRLRQINLEVDRLQRCRNKESNQILAGLKSKDPAKRKKARADYKLFAKKVKADNRFIDQLLAKSGKRIAEHEKTIAQINKIKSNTNVRSGYNIRTAPSTKTGRIIGRTGSRVTIKQVQGSWVSIDYSPHENAYVHIKAFPSLTPGKKNNMTANNVHAVTKIQHAESVEKKSDYAKDMNFRLSEMDEANIT